MADITPADFAVEHTRRFRATHDRMLAIAIGVMGDARLELHRLNDALDQTIAALTAALPGLRDLVVLETPDPDISARDVAALALVEAALQQFKMTIPYRCDDCGDTGWFDCYCGQDTCICCEPSKRLCPQCGGETMLGRAAEWEVG